jgi:predicted ribosomally synthesized peptide with SipW-like signal peptide
MAIFGAIGVAALALIGAGAAATFNATTTSSQTINAGTLSVVVSSPDAPGCTTSADNCTTLTLDSVGPEGSTFDTPASLITITNTGSIPATEISMTISDTPVNSAGLDNGGTLASEMGLCMYSDGAPVVNGDLSAVEGGSPYDLGDSLLAGTPGTDSYSADFYAGEGSSECGATAIGVATDTAATTPLTTLAEGGSDTVSLAITYNG